MAIPALTVEIGFGASWKTASPTWTDVTSYVLDGVSWSSGRGRDSTALTAGTAKLTLRNRDDRFTPQNTAGPYSPNVVPLVPIRIRATWDSTTYDCWRGLVREWQCDWSNPSDARVTLDCVDTFRVFGQHQIESQYRDKVVAHNPTYYWRCGKHPAAFHDQDLVDETDNNYRGAAMGMDVGSATGLIGGDADGALNYGTSGNLWAIQPDTSAGISGTENFTVGFWWDGQNCDMTGGVANFRKWCQQFASATDYIFIGIDTTTNYPRLELCKGGTTQSVISTSGLASNSGAVFIVATRSGSTLTLYINGASAATLSSAAVSITAAAMHWGNDHSVVQPMRGTMDEIFVIRGTALSAAQISALYDSGTGYVGDTAGQRVVRVLDAIGWPNTGSSSGSHRSIDQRSTGAPGNGHMRSWTAPASVLQLLQDCVTAEDGDCHIARDGAVRFIDGHGRPASVDEHVAASFPAGYWRLQETSGTTATDTHEWPTDGYPYPYFGYVQKNGTYTGGPTLDRPGLIPEWEPNGNSVGFDGTNDYVTVTDAAQFDFTTEFAMGAMVRVDTLTTERPIVAKSNSGGRDWWLVVDTAGKVRCGLRTSGGTTYEAVSSSAITPGNRYAVMGWYDDAANTIAVAVSGSVTTASVSGSVSAGTSSRPVEIGRRHDGSAYRYFDGDISHVWVSQFAAPAGSRAAAGWTIPTWADRHFDDTLPTPGWALPYIDAQFVFEEQRIANQVRASYSGEEEILVEDATSIATYGTRPVSISPNLTERLLGDVWGWLWVPPRRELARRKDPQWRCLSVSLNGELSPANWPTFIQLNLGTWVAVARHTYSGAAVNAVGVVDRVEHSVSKGRWDTAIQLSS